MATSKESSEAELMRHSDDFIRTLVSKSMQWTLIENICIYTLLFIEHCKVHKIQNACSLYSNRHNSTTPLRYNGKDRII